MKQNSQTALSFKKIIANVTIIFLAFYLYSGPVFAHTKLVKSDPPKRATLNAAPEKIQLWFNEEIEGNFASILLHDAEGKLITDKKPEIIPDNLKTIVLPLPEIAPGKYTVNYRIMSADGHVVESDYRFTIKNTN